MGYSISWIAFHGLSKGEVLSITRLIDTAEPDEANESPISGSEVPGGWFVLFLNDIVHPYVSHERLREFSLACTVLGAQVEEHVMVSASFLYKNGARIWSITHEAEKGVYNMEIDGQPPDSFSISEFREAQDRAGGEAAGVDHMFDAPLELARRICGYRHDRCKFDWGQPRFRRLEAESA